ncbi:MAG: CotH kinase family protein [Cyclobacteriaceae bacterium]
MPSNYMTIEDEFAEYSDWFEVTNQRDALISLKEYRISDRNNFDSAWAMPDIILDSGSSTLFFASDRDLKQIPLHWYTILDEGDSGKYLVPDTIVPDDWIQPHFVDTSWSGGRSGYGYDDGDDNTVLDGALSVYVRMPFTVKELGNIRAMLLHIDYDDGIVAYINGQEVARGNMAGEGMPSFDTFADDHDHEAALYQGGQPDTFLIENFREIIKEGENLLAVQVHNANLTSSDLSLIPFISFGTLDQSKSNLSDKLNVTSAWSHTDFKLDADGDTLYLFDPQGTLIHQLSFPPLRADESYGIDQGGVERHFLTATPGERNAGAYHKIDDQPLFSVLGGVYAKTQALELQGPQAQDKVYYTLDGSMPDTSSFEYSEPIDINQTVLVKARVVRGNIGMGPVVAQSYILRTPHSLPILSLAVEPDHFFDYHTGIYAHGPNTTFDFPHFGANFWNDWERPIVLEMFEPNGDMAFRVRAGTKIFGNYSRGQDQRSLGIYLRKAYGDKEIKYQIFEDNILDEFSRIVLRNSGNDWNNTMFRDALMATMFHESIDRQSYRPAVLYINGDYWGIHNIREKINDEYVESHYGYKKGEFAMLEGHFEEVEGHADEYISLMEYISRNDLSEEAHYAYVSDRIDIDNYIYYSIGNIFIDNGDWPGNNIKYWKPNEAGKWRWIAYDADFGFGIWNAAKVFSNTLEFALEVNGPEWPNPPWSTFLLRSLLTNDTFKNRFVTLFADQLNTRLRAEETSKRLERMLEKIEDEIPRHLARWSSSIGYWRQNVDDMREFARQRPQIMFGHLKQYFELGSSHDITLSVNIMNSGHIKVNSIEPQSYPWVGHYFAGIPVQLEAKAAPGYRFKYWIGSLESKEAQIEVIATDTTSLTAVFEPADDQLRSMVINEIFYKSGEEEIEDWVELFNRGDEVVDVSNWIFSDEKNSFRLPSGVEIASGETLVLTRSESNFYDHYGSTGMVSGDFDFGLSADGECLTLKNESGVIADEVCYESISPWPNANGNGYSITLVNPHGNNALPTNWTNVADNGTPGVLDHVVLKVESENTSIYPNPGNALINIQSDNLRVGPIQVVIYQLDGKRVFHADLLYSINKGLQFDPDLPTGKYMLRLKDESGNVFSGKLLRQ